MHHEEVTALWIPPTHQSDILNLWRVVLFRFNIRHSLYEAICTIRDLIYFFHNEEQIILSNCGAWFET